MPTRGATARSTLAVDEPFGELHVYQPHRTGIPSLPPYIREMWRRRHFAAELSRSGMRAAHTTTFFGQLWLVINPLLLAVVYYILVNVLAGGHGQGGAFFAHICGGLFAFSFVASCMMTGGSSVLAGGGLVMNTAMPRLLLPMSAVRTGFMRFLPTMIVYAALHLIAGLPVSPRLLLALPILGLLTLFATGLACLFGMLFVYFRDISSFLPYFNRIWLYLSPVLYETEQIHQKFVHMGLPWLAHLNPLYSLLGMWSDVLSDNQNPPLDFWLVGTGWSLLTFAGGALLFLSREREFAVRI